MTCLLPQHGDDENPCTQDACDDTLWQCKNEPAEGCCQTADECDDGNPCTFDDNCVGAPDERVCDADIDCGFAASCFSGVCSNPGKCSGYLKTCPAVDQCQQICINLVYLRS